MVCTADFSDTKHPSQTRTPMATTRALSETQPVSFSTGTLTSPCREDSQPQPLLPGGLQAKGPFKQYQEGQLLISWYTGLYLRRNLETASWQKENVYVHSTKPDPTTSGQHGLEGGLTQGGGMAVCARRHSVGPCWAPSLQANHRPSGSGFLSPDA